MDTSGTNRNTTTPTAAIEQIMDMVDDLRVQAWGGTGQTLDEKVRKELAIVDRIRAALRTALAAQQPPQEGLTPADDLPPLLGVDAQLAAQGVQQQLRDLRQDVMSLTRYMADLAVASTRIPVRNVFLAGEGSSARVYRELAHLHRRAGGAAHPVLEYVAAYLTAQEPRGKGPRLENGSFDHEGWAKQHEQLCAEFDAAIKARFGAVPLEGEVEQHMALAAPAACEHTGAKVSAPLLIGQAQHDTGKTVSTNLVSLIRARPAGMSACQRLLRELGQPYLRTCQVCGLGPCVVAGDTGGASHD